MHKDMKKLIAQVEAQGGSVTLTRNGHLMFRDSDNRVVATGAGTPSDPRSWKNLRAALRRSGFDV